MERPLQILLIEDNPGDAFLIKFYLEESTFKDAALIHAEFMGTAIDLLTKNPIDVILLDLNLPDCRGIETLETVLAAKKDCVVIVLTGLDDEDLGVQTVKLGAQDFLVKGQFDGKVLTSSIRYAFERYKLQREVENYTDKLDESKQRFEQAQLIGRFGYWELNLENKQMYWSDAMRELMQLPAEAEANLQGLVAALGDSSKKETEQAFANAIAGTADVDICFEAKGVEFECRSNTVKDDKGKIVYLAGIIRER